LITILVEPGVTIVGTITKLPTNILVEVEAMMTIFGGRTADTGADRSFLMSVVVSGSGSVQITMASHEERRWGKEGGEGNGGGECKDCAL